jgi:hypothetical protein
VLVDGHRVDAAYVHLEDALRGAVRTFKRVGYLWKHVTPFFARGTREKLNNFWLVGIAADGFPLRAGVSAFQLALEVRSLCIKSELNVRCFHAAPSIFSSVCESYGFE